jgi:hypothetical protein
MTTEDKTYNDIHETQKMLSYSLESLSKPFTHCHYPWFSVEYRISNIDELQPNLVAKLQLGDLIELEPMLIAILFMEDLINIL